MVVIGGIIATNTGSGLANMDSVWVYKIDTNEWVVRNVSTTGARFPSTCSDHSAVVSKCNKKEGLTKLYIYTYFLCFSF